MKVILLSNWGGKIPQLLKPFTNNGNNWRWGHAINFIETNAINATSMLPAEVNAKILCYPGSTSTSRTYLFKEDGVTVHIVDVDTTRPWAIESYDGAEYIQYLDYNIIDKNINFCELPKS